MFVSRTRAFPCIIFAILAAIGSTRLNNPWDVALGIVAALLLVIGL